MDIWLVIEVWIQSIALRIREQILKNTLPLLSLNPSRLPAIEKGWQGNPAHNISTLGNVNSLISKIS